MAEYITGFHAIEEALKDEGLRGTLFICRNMEKRNDRLESLARYQGKVKVKKVARVEMDRMSPDIDHRGALLSITVRDNSTSKAYTVSEFISSLSDSQAATVLILDGITDVQNLGAIMRSADQFAVSLVVVPSRRSAQNNATVERISSGASRHVPTATVTNLVREIEYLQKAGFWIYGADMNGEKLTETKFPPRTAIIMGSEGSGLSDLIRKKCDFIVSIPTHGHIDSLNVSVAAGIMLYEVSRQR